MVNYQQVINYLSTTFQLLCHITCFNCEITTLYQIVIVATQKNRKRTPTVVKMRYHHQIYPCQNSRLKFVEQKTQVSRTCRTSYTTEVPKFVQYS